MPVEDIEIRIKPGTPLIYEPTKGHNRWHPAIPPIAYCKPGETVLLETRDAMDGQISPSTTLPEAEKADLNLVHPLTGPVYVEGAEVGDLLEVEILDIKPDVFGYTTVSPNFGFLRDLFPDRYLVKWNIQSGVATSDQLPGIVISGEPFMGIMGVAPDYDLLERAAFREQQSLERGEFGSPPIEPEGALPRSVGFEALRTGPPRENGGNLDIKQTGIGAKVFFPVLVPGALFSAGDAHFAQGDGEVCGTAIEICASLKVRFQLHKRKAATEGISSVRFLYTEKSRSHRQYMAVTGLSLADDGTNVSESMTLAARRAIQDMIKYIGSRGYDPQQSYAICSVAMDLRLSEIVDAPNFIVTAFLPLDIFLTSQ